MQLNQIFIYQKDKNSSKTKCQVKLHQTQWTQYTTNKCFWFYVDDGVDGDGDGGGVGVGDGDGGDGRQANTMVHEVVNNVT